MGEKPMQDLNDGKPWSEMDLFDLRNSCHFTLHCSQFWPARQPTT
jgi:hypothetical protein